MQKIIWAYGIKLFIFEKPLDPANSNMQKHLQNFQNLNVYSGKTENVQIPLKLCNLLACVLGFLRVIRCLNSITVSRTKYRFSLVCLLT